MADLTLQECRKCQIPLSCCSKEYCLIAENYAKDQYQINLQRTNNEKLPFMSENGCIVPPYLRPLCTFHTCKINSIGTSGNTEWDQKYFELREEIEEKMYHL